MPQSDIISDILIQPLDPAMRNYCYTGFIAYLVIESLQPSRLPNDNGGNQVTCWQSINTTCPLILFKNKLVNKFISIDGTAVSKASSPKTE